MRKAGTASTAPQGRAWSRLPRYLADRYSSRANGARARYAPPAPALNIGTGGVDRVGWVNIDETKPGDLLARVPPIPIRTGSVREIYLGHVLEHLDIGKGLALLKECRRVLQIGGTICVVTPDTRAITLAYLLHQVGNRELNDLYIYSYAQESPHRWCYDYPTLAALVAEAGFVEARKINRFREPRLVESAWYQTGLIARTPKSE